MNLFKISFFKIKSKLNANPIYEFSSIFLSCCLFETLILFILYFSARYLMVFFLKKNLVKKFKKQSYIKYFKETFLNILNICFFLLFELEKTINDMF